MSVWTRLFRTGVFLAPLMVATFVFADAYVPPSLAVDRLNNYRSHSELTKAAKGMDIDQYTYNMTTWQIDNGGFFKGMASSYTSAYSGGDKSPGWPSATGGYVGTIDNNATIQEMRLLAVRYKETTNSNYKNAFKASFNKAVNFLLTMQRSTGGLPQVWPKRNKYNDHITLNDDAMVRAVVAMMDVANAVSPFDSDIVDDATRAKMKAAVGKAVDYLVKAQIVNNGQPTVWCAQHDTATYAPQSARAYELESKSGKESVGVIWVLMNQPEQTEAIQKSVKAAIAWYKKTKVSGLVFSQKKGIFEEQAGKSLWYRFYEVNSDDYFFCDRDGISTKTRDFNKISEERRTGYQWASDYGSAILSVESDYLTALEKAAGSYVAPAAMCGEDSCKTFIDGVDFVDIKGVKESSNRGFVGEGYANVDNDSGSYVIYGVTAAKAGEYALTIRFANGGTSVRSYDLYVGDLLLVEGVSMGSTGNWTAWETQTVPVPLEKGYSELKFVSTSKDGMANIDYIGWMSEDLYAGEKNLVEIDGPDAIGMRNIRPAEIADRYYVDFGSRNTSAGVYLKNANGKVFNVNGKLR